MGKRAGRAPLSACPANGVSRGSDLLDRVLRCRCPRLRVHVRIAQPIVPARSRRHVPTNHWNPIIEPRRSPMDTVKMSEDINHHRRRFLSAAAMTIAAAELVMIGSADAQPSKTKPAVLPAIKPGTNTSFASLKQIDAGVLTIGYA